jgi:hypothetical protein
VRTENLIRIELVMKSRHAGNDDRLDFPGPQSAGCVLQVQEPTWSGKCCTPAAAVLQRKVRGRIEFDNGDRLFFVQLYRWCEPAPNLDPAQLSSNLLKLH